VLKNKVIIVGGGATGFFCAVNLAKFNPELNITILEKQNKVLQKVKVSGGGRCNVTHACFQLSDFTKKYPRGKSFLKKSLQLFSAQSTIDWFNEHQIQLKAESDGRMFPITNSSQTVIDCLLKESGKHRIDLKLSTSVEYIKKEKDLFIINTKAGETLTCNYLMIACGGFQQLSQYDWLKHLGHTIEAPVPSLFTFNIPDGNLKSMMGLVVENAIVKIIDSKLSEQGPVLITHWGLSGPAILRLSAWGAKELNVKNYHFQIVVNWLGQAEHDVRNEWNTIRDREGGNLLFNKNPFGLPNRLWNYLLAFTEVPEQMKWSELPSKLQNKLIHHLTSNDFTIKGKTTFKEEFVTCGGIKLDEVNAQTMESKLVSQLYFGGEILNVDGITGGFNFQHAWTSGFIAAQSIATKTLA
jgi:predicted Rossmann fold flavoprotein